MIILKSLQSIYLKMANIKANYICIFYFISLISSVQSQNNDMKKKYLKTSHNILQYILNDFQFLQDYEIIEKVQSGNNMFIAQIKNSSQKVRFLKIQFSQELFKRFKVLYKLYKSGIILADNMFIIEECDQLFFYVIEAELEFDNDRFRSLHQFLFEKNPSQEERKSIMSKVKILLDCLHQQGQAFAGLDSRSIIIDDQNHLYLAPYALRLQLKTDQFSRAYYPPEVLSMINQGKTQIEELDIFKWDYWSFGCIAAEILLYSSPIFFETSSAKQLKNIMKFSIEEEFINFEEMIKNIMINSLHFDSTIRNISTTKMELKEEVNLDLRKTIKGPKRLIQYSKSEITELNLYAESSSGDSELIFNLVSLQNIDFKEELHVVIYLDRKYHFYIDHEASSKYKLNKKITIVKNFKDIAKLLSQPVLIQVKEKGKVSKILVSLQSLVMMHQGRRIWNKKLLGTYKPDKECDNSQAKLKINCVLNSPQTFVEEFDENYKIARIQTSLVQDEVIALPLTTRPLEEITNISSGEKKKKKNQNRIPSISQISNNITSITQQFMQKLSIREPTKYLAGEVKIISDDKAFP